MNYLKSKGGRFGNSPHSRDVGERPAAFRDVADVRLLSRVRPRVQPEVVAPRKLLSAHLAHIGAVAGMSPLLNKGDLSFLS